MRGVIDALYGVPASLLRSLKIIRGFRPDCIIGLGGYASGPALLAAKLAGIRCAIMEQNLRPGFTNKLLARLVDRVFTAYPRERGLFSRRSRGRDREPGALAKTPRRSQAAKIFRC